MEATIGRRWAKALVENIEKEADLRKVDDELSALGALLAEKGEFREAMLNPGFTAEMRQSVLDEIAKANKMHDVTQRFLALVVVKDRLPYIPMIAREFRTQVDEKLGRVRAFIESANEMKDADVDKVVKALAKKTGKEVVADVATDPSLIAGMRARIGGLVFDNTVRSKLERMRSSLT